MTFCGYNDTMARGLQLFVEGMIEAMLLRHKSGLPMEEVVRTELLDLAEMNESLGQGKRQSDDLLNALVAINIFAQTIFSRAIVDNVDAESFANACRSACLEFVNLVKLTEEQHLSELHKRDAKHGNVPAIQAVGEWLLQYNNHPIDEKVAELFSKRIA